MKLNKFNVIFFLLIYNFIFGMEKSYQISDKTEAVGDDKLVPLIKIADSRKKLPICSILDIHPLQDIKSSRMVNCLGKVNNDLANLLIELDIEFVKKTSNMQTALDCAINNGSLEGVENLLKTEINEIKNNKVEDNQFTSLTVALKSLMDNIINWNEAASLRNMDYEINKQNMVHIYNNTPAGLYSGRILDEDQHKDREINARKKVSNMISIIYLLLSVGYKANKRDLSILNAIKNICQSQSQVNSEFGCNILSISLKFLETVIV